MVDLECVDLPEFILLYPPIFGNPPIDFFCSSPVIGGMLTLFINTWGFLGKHKIIWLVVKMTMLGNTENVFVPSALER